MEQTRAEAPIRAGRTALQPRVPAQPQQRSQPSAAGASARADGDPAARGEHVHSEPAPPLPAAAPPEPPRAAPPPCAAPVRTGQAPEHAASEQAPEPAEPAEPAERADPAARPRHARHAKPKLPRRHSVRAQILAALRDALFSGELAPGEVYSAPALAERFGVSPTPVREAMQQLVCEGAVETVPNRGFRVAECSVRDLSEFAEIRAMLEIPAVLRLARSAPPDSWVALRPLAEDTLTAAACGDRAAYATADRAFHRGLLELTGNRRLVEVAEDVQRRAQRAPAPVAPTLGAAELLGDASEHVALLDALKVCDLPAVERLLHEHVAVV